MKKLTASLMIILSAFTDPELTLSQLIWNIGLSLSANHKPKSFRNPVEELRSYIDLDDIKENDLIYLHPSKLRNFIENDLSKIFDPILLIINGDDHTFPDFLNEMTLFEKLISSPLIRHIFAQNCSISTHPKITQIPIGLDFHMIAYSSFWGEPKKTVKEQESILLSIRENSIKQPKLLKACADFHFNDSIKNGNSGMEQILGETRRSIYNRLKYSKDVYFFLEPQPRHELWIKKTKFTFSICPAGNGYDTYRIWEDLALGIIPIVKSSPLDPLYRQFPIVILSDWNEINSENLKKWYLEFKDAIASESTFQKLQLNYWLEKIEKVKNSSL